jgi:hypothetical protein
MARKNSLLCFKPQKSAHLILIVRGLVTLVSGAELLFLDTRGYTKIIGRHLNS